MNCHCESCRRATASPVTTFVGVPWGAFEWTGEEPKEYASSPGVTRDFCGTCGTPMFFADERDRDNIHLYVATLMDPNAIPPQAHVHTEEALEWFTISDHLRRFPEAGQ
ncbi:GFA family protein [Rubricella aquisinus]